MEKGTLFERVQRGLRWLKNNQTSAGNFTSNSSFDPNHFGGSKIVSTTFYTSCVLLALQPIKEDSIAEDIIKGGLAYLKGQQHRNGSFNYWSNHTPEARQFPYPDDLDDTCLSWSCCYLYDPQYLTGHILANLTKLLTGLEQAPGGPYYTWITNKLERCWKYIDLAVNCNIGFFLKLLNIQLPDLQNYFEQAIRLKKIYSPYYSSIHAPLYFLARSYEGAHVQALREIIATEQLTGNSSTPLNRALLLTSQLRLGASTAEMEQEINELGLYDWNDIIRPYPFVIERINSDHTIFSGSASWTIAAYIEALCYYYRKSQQNKIATKQLVSIDQGNRVYRQIISSITNRFAKLDQPLQQNALRLLTLTIEKDKNQQRALVPNTIYNALISPTSIDERLLVSLGAVTLYGWIAYTIYDDFFDNNGVDSLEIENGHISTIETRELDAIDKLFSIDKIVGKTQRQLPLAHICLRELTALYALTTRYQPLSQKLFCEIMDTMESSTVWELENCRGNITQQYLRSPALPDYGDYGRLADRSLGHALGPLTIWHLQGYKQDDPSTKHLLNFFRHYLIARQLNDDIHDWEEDLQRGQLSSVVTLLLKRWLLKTNQPPTKPIQLNLVFAVTDLRALFWDEVVPEGCALTQQHIRLAEEHLQQLASLIHIEQLQTLLRPLATATEKALTEQKRMIEFLHHYTPALANEKTSL